MDFALVQFTTKIKLKKHYELNPALVGLMSKRLVYVDDGSAKYRALDEEGNVVAYGDSFTDLIEFWLRQYVSEKMREET